MLAVQPSGCPRYAASRPMHSQRKPASILERFDSRHDPNDDGSEALQVAHCFYFTPASGSIRFRVCAASSRTEMSLSVSNGSSTSLAASLQVIYIPFLVRPTDTHTHFVIGTGTRLPSGSTQTTPTDCELTDAGRRKTNSRLCSR